MRRHDKVPGVEMPNVDDAIRFLLDFARSPRNGELPTFGYEIYLPNVLDAFLREVRGTPGHGSLGRSTEAEAMSPVFFEAAWELCRRGIIRPGLSRIGGQSTDLGKDGCGYSVTESGRAWLHQANELQFVPMEASRLAQIMAGFRTRLGDGYYQRAQEATRCHFAAAYLASCAMSGAAAESILLKLAITKSGDEQKVLKAYRAANGRSRVENMVVGKLKEPLASRLRSLMDLLKYWRDEAAHGSMSEISEYEAYEAMARLLRLAHLAVDHWDDLTTK